MFKTTTTAAVIAATLVGGQAYAQYQQHYETDYAAYRAAFKRHQIQLWGDKAEMVTCVQSRIPGALNPDTCHAYLKATGWYDLPDTPLPTPEQMRQAEEQERCKYGCQPAPAKIEDRGFIGVKWHIAKIPDSFDLNMSDREVIDTGLDKHVGLRIDEVIAGGPAAQDGLQKNDLVLAYNDKTMQHGEDLTDFIKRFPGSVVELTIWRNHQTSKLHVTIGTK
jgi:hypothetical protein